MDVVPTSFQRPESHFVLLCSTEQYWMDVVVRSESYFVLLCSTA